MTLDVAEAPPAAPERARRGLVWRLALVFAAFVVLLAVHWLYSYNPLAQRWPQSKGEFGSYVGTTSGVEAHFTTSVNPEELMNTTVWNEPTGKFVVEFETEINNTGSHAVRIDSVGEPSFGYRTSGYRVSFYRNKPFPNEAGAPFRPFTLSGHSERIVTVSYSQSCSTIAPVEEDGRAMPSGPTSLPVTFSFSGFNHTDDVPVAPFEFVAPPHC